MANDRSVRLNKYLAECGVASRRKADRLIIEGQVTVNGHTSTELGQKVHPNKDKVLVNGRPVRPDQNKVYIAYHKPEGMLSTTSDPEGRPTVMDVFHKAPHRMFPVGRLDWNSEGLILITNDGDFAQQVLHPRQEIAKTYLVKLDGQPSIEQLQKLVRGVSIIGGKARAKHVERIRGESRSDRYDWVKIIITEGRNHQVRNMFAKIGFDVKRLRRVAIGQLKLGSLPAGQFRLLDGDDIKKIFARENPVERAVYKRQRTRQKSTKRLS